MALGRARPTAGPWRKSSHTGDGTVLAAVITAGKTFLLLAKFRNGSSAPIELKQFTLDVPQGWKSELFMDKVPEAHRARATAAR